nr:immunoglobulin heavy chain junction region [Mus musculus]
CAFFSGFA